LQRLVGKFALCSVEEFSKIELFAHREPPGFVGYFTLTEENLQPWF
jgi:hypothetical protein